MPIYAYKCSACGHAQDALQKMSDAPLTVCPQCNQPTYVKQVTAAGFQLKGSGWYVTDFRDKSSGTTKTSEPAPAATAADSGGAAPAAPAATPAAGAAATTAAPATSAPAAAPATTSAPAASSTAGSGS